MDEASHLFDLLTTVAATASTGVVAAVLAFALSKTVRGHIRAAFFITLWFVTIVAFGATGALGPQSLAGIPGLAASIVLPIAALCFAFLFYPPAREAISQVPLSVLISVNILRVLGVSFLVLYSVHRLPAPFAPVAGWGDIVTGALAGPVAWIAARYNGRAKPLVLTWNLIGFIDLIAAVGLGATSAPGPIRLFLNPPGTSILTTLPWIIIPCFLVPIFEALHIAIFYRLFPSGARSRTEYDLGISSAAAR